eukprot:2692777-Alexandrium_andersonii.AAC.1
MICREASVHTPPVATVCWQCGRREMHRWRASTRAASGQAPASRAKRLSIRSAAYQRENW